LRVEKRATRKKRPPRKIISTKKGKNPKKGKETLLTKRKKRDTPIQGATGSESRCGKQAKKSKDGKKGKGNDTMPWVWEGQGGGERGGMDTKHKKKYLAPSTRVQEQEKRHLSRCYRTSVANWWGQPPPS